MRISSIKNGLEIGFTNDVDKIEVMDTVQAENDVDDGVSRVVRVITGGGKEVLEIFLTASSGKRLRVQHVREFKAIPEPSEPSSEWLTPKLYKGKSMHEMECDSEA